MNFRFLSGAVAAALVSIGSAQAAAPASQTFELGTLSPAFSTVQNRFVDPGQTFTDYLNFSLLASPLSTVLSAVTFPNQFGFQPGTFTATLYNAPSGGGTAVGAVGTGGGSFSSLAAGSYSIVVTGTALASPAVGAAYTLAVAAPVPEPHEWAMMLAGLGLVGWAARRSRRDEAAPALAAA